MNSRLLENDYEVLNVWAIEPKVVKSKKYVKAETIIQVKTKASAYALYQNQKDYCDQNKIRIISVLRLSVRVKRV